MKKKEFDAQKALGLITYMKWDGEYIHKILPKPPTFVVHRIFKNYVSRTEARKVFQEELNAHLIFCSKRQQRILRANYKWKLSWEVLYKEHD